MKTVASSGKIVLSAFIGAAAGFLLLHPYSMAVHVLHERQGVLLQDLLKAAASSFMPTMLSMGIPFAILGAVAGLFFGLWQENRKKRAECEKQLARWLH